VPWHQLSIGIVSVIECIVPEIVEIAHDIHSTGNRFIICALRHDASVSENIQGKKRENSTNLSTFTLHGNRFLSLHVNILSDSIRFLLSVNRSICKHTQYE
jgi:hypothetical protein